MQIENKQWIILLLAITLLIQGVSASQTTIYVDPPNIYDPTLVPGTNFSINVSLSDVTNLYGFEFKLGYYLDYLNVSSVAIQPFLNTPTIIAKNETNYDDGYVWIAVSSSSPAEPKSGSGVLTTITFQVLDIVDAYFNIYDTNLTDYSGNSIAHGIVGGYFSNNPATTTSTTSSSTSTTTSTTSSSTTSTTISSTSSTTSSSTTTSSTTTTSTTSSSTTSTSLSPTTTIPTTTLPPLEPYAPDMTPVYIIIALGVIIPVVVLLIVSREFT